MANKFVWSGAAGLNDGSTWEDAYTSGMRDWGAEAGFTPGTDRVYFRDSHAESTAAALTITGTTVEGATAPVHVFCVVGAATGTTPGARSSGASVTTTGANDILIQEYIYIDGVNFFSGDDIHVGTSTDSDIVLENCRLEIVGVVASDLIRFNGAAANAYRCRLIDCVIDFAAAGQHIFLGGGALCWSGGSLAFNVNDLIASGSRPATVDLENLDLSVLTNNLVAGAAFATNLRVKATRCLLGTGATIQDQTIDLPGLTVETIHCQIGTDADPAYQVEFHSTEGKVVTDATVYRTGGASDDERTNPIAWDMDTTVNTKRSWPGHALESPPITGWTDGDASTAHTYRIYFASGATQQDDDVWFDLVGPNDAATDSLGLRNTTRVAPEGTPADYTTDGSSTWTGSGVGTKQYMEITYTPDKPGSIAAVVYMATDAGAAGHIFIDPKIYIDP
jgi:hypothetical protein